MELCSKCNKCPIINKKYKLCDGCNYVRLNGETKQQNQLRKSDARRNNAERISKGSNNIIGRSSERRKNFVARKPIVRTPIKQKFRKPTGELALFQQIWNERPHTSEISGRSLGEFSIHYFSHILTKGAYPSYRLEQKNIKLVTSDEHDLWEFGDRTLLRTLPEWQWVFERADELKYLYYNPKK